MIGHIAFIILVCDRFSDRYTFKTIENHPSEAAHPYTCRLPKKVVVIFFFFFVMYTETTMKYALCCCSMLCFAWYFVSRQSLGKWLHTAPFWLGSSIASLKPLDSVVAAVLYATVPLGILCAVPFLGGRGYSWWVCSLVPSRYLLSWVENDFINCFI